jgi:O-antigen ligase
MSVARRPERPPNPLVWLLDRLGPVLLTIIAGIVLGLQFIMPNKRVIPVLSVIVMFGLIWRVDMIAGLGVLAIALPFPRNMSLGSTNLAFIAVLAILWLLRVSNGLSLRPRSSPLDAPVLALFVAYVVSFYNVTTAQAMSQAVPIFQLRAASMLMLFMIVNNLRDERGFRRFLDFQTVSVLLVCLLALWELANPGRSFIPGWIEFSTGPIGDINLHSLRVGSSFTDYELLSEYCALNALLVMFLLLRAETMLRRVAYGALLSLLVFVLFATVTRGAMVALAAGVVYLLWIVRRRLNFVTLVTVGAALLATMQGMSYYLASFTRSGSVITRFATDNTAQFVGMLPVARAATWLGAWERIFEHPFIGHGPYFSATSGMRTYFWPHNLYLFVANNVGFIGFGIFLWLLWTLLRMSRPRTDDLRHGDFLHSYMIIAQAQMIVFLIDETKIEFMRNSNYELQIWLMFALTTAAYQITHAPPLPAVVPTGGPPGIRR